MSLSRHNKRLSTWSKTIDSQPVGCRLGNNFLKSMSNYLVILACLCSFLTDAQTIKVTVNDCGPLARGELGVVFSTKPHESGMSYFTYGEASEICPKLDKAKYVIGREEPYCKNYKPYHIRECEHLKVFVIEKYVLD